MNKRFSFRADTSSGALFGRLFIPITATVILFIFLVSLLVYLFSGKGITRSTTERIPVTEEYISEKEFYTDNAGIISSGQTLENGMQSFLEKTGVAPYLYIVNTTDELMQQLDVADNNTDKLMSVLYSQLFSDNVHFLVLYDVENKKTEYYCGSNTLSVMDEEALNIFDDYVHKNNNMSDAFDESFSSAFEDTSVRIMSITTLFDDFDMPMIIGILILLLLISVFVISIIQNLKYNADKQDSSDIDIQYDIRNR